MAANELDTLLANLPPAATASRALLEAVRDSDIGIPGKYNPMDLITPLMGAIVVLELRVIELEKKP